MSDTHIIFESDDLLAINKAAGTSFHSEGEQLGVATSLQQITEKRLWPVHRLDKITSGVLVFAKSQEAAVKLNELFFKRQVNKTYIALSHNKPKKKQGKIVGDMVKTRNGSWKLTANKVNPAVTEFNSMSLVPGIRFFWVKPETGKTHQIRVALKAIGSPITGDSRYGGITADRAYLHAYQLQFMWNNALLTISCLPSCGENFLIPELTTCITHFTEENSQ